jgi:hypothetical protein
MTDTLHRRPLTEAGARAVAELIPWSIDTAYAFPAKAVERQLIIDTVTSELIAASIDSAAGGDGEKALLAVAQNTTDTVMSARRSAAASSREYLRLAVLRGLQRALRGADADWYQVTVAEVERAGDSIVEPGATTPHTTTGA